ncbi:MAG: aldo/keto reductase [Spirosomataceae bacterium]
MHSPTLTLNNGIEIPQIGLGVYDPKFGDETYKAALWALELGYRHIDTAKIYGNEDQVGRALRESKIPRNEVFITTKVWDTDQGFDSTLKAYDQSLKQLGLDYVDLYLIHWPVRDKRKESYKALEKLYHEGRVRAIGVSNYLVPHLEELFTYAEVIPAVNQFELTPYCYQPETIALCQAKGIQIETYSPLVRGLKQNDPRLIKIAEKYDKSTYQVLVRWAVQQGFVTIPKSSNYERLKANMDVFDFELSAEEIALMNTFHDGTRVADDPMSYL